MNELKKKALEYNEGGKISVESKVSLKNQRDLSLAYTPGVAEPSRKIAEDEERVYDYTSKGNTVAVVSDGSAVLGLGNIGGEASLPVMEGKSVLFKLFAGIDAFPICLDKQEESQITKITQSIEPSFGGINLEDITAPKCFKIEEELKKTMNIPVFHDDQHGTAIIVLGAIINSLKLLNKKIGEVKAIISGAGASGIAIAKILKNAGIGELLLVDSEGIIYPQRKNNMNPYKKEIAKKTNPENIQGDLETAMKDSDIFIGVSAPNIVSKDMVKKMKEESIVFAMANPEPEIFPDKVKEAGAQIVGSGRSDYPNQVNNVLGFPGIFRGALDIRASDINEEMKIAAAEALAELARKKIPKEVKEAYPDENLNGFNFDYVIPKPLDARVVPEVAKAVAEAGIKSGVARKKVSPNEVKEKTKEVVSKINS
ncbi:NAD-dependent malic enzyme [archaeon SCG-AAA382B04]|nr:NAD-dependent malic enzyme [archaeon SCG-AAA382B04]